MQIVVVICISFILLLSVCFELCREFLNESVAEAFKPILTSLYSELTLLGFIGLLLFAIFKMESLHDLSLLLFGDEEEIEEIGEQVHMVLFLVMAIFLAQAVALARFGSTIQEKWQLWEVKSLFSESDKKSNGKEYYKRVLTMATEPASFLSLCLESHRDPKYRLLLHTVIRLHFLDENELHKTDFEFARYLSVALGHTLGELVEVPAKTWLFLEILLLFFWQAELRAPPNVRLALWIATGYVVAAATYITHGKLRLIIHDYCAPIIKARALAGFDFQTAHIPPARMARQQTLVANGAVIPVARRPVALATCVVDEEAPEDKAEKEDKFSYVSMFWQGKHHRAHFTFDCVRLISLLTSIYISIFSLVYVDDLLCSFAPDDFSEAAHAWRARGGRLGGVLVLFVAVVPVVMVLSKITRLLEDFTVCSNIGTLSNRRLVELVLRRQKTVAAFEALKIVQCLSCPKMLEHVLSQDAPSPEDEMRRQTPSPFDDRAPSPVKGFFDRLLGKNAQTTRPYEAVAADMSNMTPRGSMIAKFEDDEHDAHLERQQTRWHKIFVLFDKDGEGSIDRDEMRSLLEKFSRAKPDPARQGQGSIFDKVIDTLDADNSNTISFEEFYDFASKLTLYLQGCDPKKLAEGMFEIIDVDGGGTITVHEMHEVVSELGQDLSVEDVFNVIQDIDTDGNGELDLEEFTILLERFGIYD